MKNTQKSILENISPQNTLSQVETNIKIELPAIIPKYSIKATCPVCKITGNTIVQEQCGIAEIMICLFCWIVCWPFALFIFLCSRFFLTFSDVIHKCRFCNSVIAENKRC